MLKIPSDILLLVMMALLSFVWTGVVVYMKNQERNIYSQAQNIPHPPEQTQATFTKNKEVFMPIPPTIHMTDGKDVRNYAKDGDSGSGYLVRMEWITRNYSAPDEKKENNRMTLYNTSSNKELPIVSYVFEPSVRRWWMHDLYESGNMLTYFQGDTLSIIDLKNNKYLWNVENANFTRDKQYIYSCTDAGVSSGSKMALLINLEKLGKNPDIRGIGSGWIDFTQLVWRGWWRLDTCKFIEWEGGNFKIWFSIVYEWRSTISYTYDSQKWDITTDIASTLDMVSSEKWYSFEKYEWQTWGWTWNLVQFFITKGDKKRLIWSYDRSRIQNTLSRWGLLFYLHQWYEWYSVNIFDLVQEKEIWHLIGWNFSADNRYIYKCNADGPLWEGASLLEIDTLLFYDAKSYVNSQQKEIPVGYPICEPIEDNRGDISGFDFWYGDYWNNAKPTYTSVYRFDFATKTLKNLKTGAKEVLTGTPIEQTANGKK